MFTGPYAPRAQAVAAQLREEDVVTVPDCGCKLANNTYRNGATAEYYKTFEEVAMAYAWHRLMGTMYWGIHLKGLHVIHIHTTAMASDCCECRERRLQ